MLYFLNKLLSFLISNKQFKPDHPIEIIIPLICFFIYGVLFQFGFNISFAYIFNLKEISLIKSVELILFINYINIFFIGILDDISFGRKRNVNDSDFVENNHLNFRQLLIGLVLPFLFFLFNTWVTQSLFNETIAYILEIPEISFTRTLGTIICLLIIKKTLLMSANNS